MRFTASLVSPKSPMASATALRSRPACLTLGVRGERDKDADRTGTVQPQGPSKGHSFRLIIIISLDGDSTPVLVSVSNKPVAWIYGVEECRTAEVSVMGPLFTIPVGILYVIWPNPNRRFSNSGISRSRSVMIPSCTSFTSGATSNYWRVSVGEEYLQKDVRGDRISLKAAHSDGLRVRTASKVYW